MSEFCSLCQVLEAEPYCPAHGVIHRSFSLDERYDLDELLGSGAMSFVFAGRRRDDGRPVAVKILRDKVARTPEVKQRFLREAAASRALIHAHVARVFDAADDDAYGVTYLVMERLSGQTAEALVRQGGLVPWRQVLPVLVQVCRGVAAGHASRIYDGHLTTRKVFLDTRSGAPVVKLCDFGISGTTAAPASAEPRDDLYGIGTIAHELLSGRTPLEGTSPAGMLSDDPIRLNERFRSLGLPGPLDELIRACRLRDPMARPSLQDIESTLAALEAEAVAVSGPAQPIAVPVAGPARVSAPVAAQGSGTAPSSGAAAAQSSGLVAAQGSAAGRAQSSEPAAAPVAAVAVAAVDRRSAPIAVAAPAAVADRRSAPVTVDAPVAVADRRSAPIAVATPVVASNLRSTPVALPAAKVAGAGSAPSAASLAALAEIALPAAPDPLALPEMIGSYKVIRVLGTGGTGRVYLGQHPVIGTKVAIKVLQPEIASSAETVARFIQEARTSSQIASPYIPRYFDFGTTPAGLPYAMMEYFDGETLGDRLERCGPMSVAETARVLEQVAGALLMAHEIGLIHRDLKPDNIFLVKPDPSAGRVTPSRAAAIATSATEVEPFQVKVLDFGIAKVLGTPSTTRTQSGYFLGTPFYCAPEQVFGGEVDRRTDVYSLGCAAFEMLSGAPPFVGEMSEVLAAKATGEAPELGALCTVPAAVADTIRRMLAREASERAPSMAWVLEQVASWPRTADAAAAAARPADAAAAPSSSPAAPAAARAGERARFVEVPPPPAKPVEPPPRPRRRAPFVLGGVMVALAGVVVVLGLSLRTRSATGSQDRSTESSAPAAGSAGSAGPSEAAPSEKPAAPTPAPADPATEPRAAAGDPESQPMIEIDPEPAAGGSDSAPPATAGEDDGSGSAGPRPRKSRPKKKTGDQKDVLIIDPFAQ